LSPTWPEDPSRQTESVSDLDPIGFVTRIKGIQNPVEISLDIMRRSEYQDQSNDDYCSRCRG